MASSQEIKIFFSDDNLIGSTSCAAVRATTRVAPATTNPMDAALRLLLKGPTQEETADNLVAFFEHPVLNGNAHQMKKPLKYYYRGVSLQNGTATVRFSKDALGYFNVPGCQKTIITAPIVKTVEQFGNVKYVKIMAGTELITP